VQRGLNLSVPAKRRKKAKLGKASGNYRQVLVTASQEGYETYNYRDDKAGSRIGTDSTRKSKAAVHNEENGLKADVEATASPFQVRRLGIRSSTGYTFPLRPGLTVRGQFTRLRNKFSSQAVRDRVAGPNCPSGIRSAKWEKE